MVHNLLGGLNLLLNVQGIFYLVLGSFVGVVFGAIPGLSGVVLLSMILAFANHISLTGVICLLLATGAASFYSASISAILLNTPAHAESFAVAFDGYPMARKGEPGRALGLSAGSTCFGGFLGCLIFVGCIQIMDQLPKVFHPPELMLLVILAILLVGTIGAQSVSKAIISGAMGLMMASIGASPLTGVYRYTFNYLGFYNGISLVALALGLIAIPQMIMVFGTATTTARQDLLGKEIPIGGGVHLTKGLGIDVIRGVAESARHWKTLIVSAVVGTITGIIPGIGAFAANFMAYGVAQQVSKRRELFGTGIPEGIIAPEGSSLAKEAGSLVPVLSLGIPGGIFGAFIISLLAIKGVTAGIGFNAKYPTIPYEMMWAIAFGGLLGTTMGVVSGPYLAKIARVPGPALVPWVLAFSVIGVYVTEATFFSVVELLAFTVMGIAFRRLGYSLASFLIALVLAPQLETNIDLTRNIFPGLTWLDRPISAFLAVAMVAVVLGKIRQERKVKRKRLEEGTEVPPELQFPVLELVTAVLIVVTCTLFTWYGFTRYDFLTNIMPGVSAIAATAGGVFCLLPAVLKYRAYRRSRADGDTMGVHGVVTADASALAVDATLALDVPPALLATVANSSSIAIGNQPDESHSAVAVEDPVKVDTASRKYPEIKDHGWGRYGQYTREVVCLIWFGALIALCYLLGFALGTVVFCAAYSWTATGRVIPRVRSRLIFTVACTALTWVAVYESLDLIHLTFTPILRF